MAYDISSATIMYVLHKSIQKHLEHLLYCWGLTSAKMEAVRAVEKNEQMDEGRSLIFQDVVGVDDQNSFFFCARWLWALQPRLRQLNEDVILLKHTQTHTSSVIVKTWDNNDSALFLWRTDSHSAPACGGPSLSDPSYSPGPPQSRSLTRSPSGTSSPPHFSSAPPLPQLRHRILVRTSAWMIKKEKSNSGNFSVVWRGTSLTLLCPAQMQHKQVGDASVLGEGQAEGRFGLAASLAVGVTINSIDVSVDAINMAVYAIHSVRDGVSCMYMFLLVKNLWCQSICYVSFYLGV